MEKPLQQKLDEVLKNWIQNLSEEDFKIYPYNVFSDWISIVIVSFCRDVFDMNALSGN